MSDGLVSDIPNFINPEIWEMYQQHRKEIRKKLTPTATKLLLMKLTRYHLQGVNVNEAITESISNGWTGVFEHDQKQQRTESAYERSERIENEQLAKYGFTAHQ